MEWPLRASARGGAPELFAVAEAEGGGVGALGLVDDEDDAAVGEDGGDTHAVDVFEGAEGSAPEFAAIEGEGGEAEIGEEGDDGLAVGDDGGGGGVVEFVEFFGARAGEVAAPEFAAGGAVEREEGEAGAIESGEEDAGADDDGRGEAGWNGGLPEGVELRGVGVIAGGDAGAIGTAELRPIGGAGRGEREGEQAEGAHTRLYRGLVLGGEAAGGDGGEQEG